MLYLTIIVGVPTGEAAVINLLYFLGCSLSAIRAHRQNGFIREDIMKRCLPAGVAAAAVGALIAIWIDTEWLHRAFGVFLLYIGFRELFYKERV